MDITIKRSDWDRLVSHEAADQYIVCNESPAQLAAEA